MPDPMTARGLSMGAIEACCLLILGLGIVLRSRAPGFELWRRDAWIVLAGALLAEDSAIRLYGFYDYHAPWHGLLDRVPVLVGVIWIFVVLSARDVARALAPRHVALFAFAVIWYDASLIEPVATHAGLWRWHEPGPFAVPWIGMLGWACYGGAVLYWLDRLPQGRRWLAILLAPLTMHALLLAIWWLALRWVGRHEPAPWNVACAALGLAVLLAALGRRLGRVPLRVIAPRIAPALFFFSLLAWTDAPPPLWAYAGTFALPWLAVTGWKR
jgi:hypothetical protein